MNENFEKCLVQILKWEGGFSNIPEDKGGATNQGITQLTYNAFRKRTGLPVQSVEYILPEEIRLIYHIDYWNVGHCHQLTWPLDAVHFDCCVNMGFSRSAKMLQDSLGGLKRDGIIGALTLYAVSKCDPFVTAHKYIDSREDTYKVFVEADPSQKIFLAGWLNRTADLRKFIGEL